LQFWKPPLWSWVVGNAASSSIWSIISFLVSRHRVRPILILLGPFTVCQESILPGWVVYSKTEEVNTWILRTMHIVNGGISVTPRTMCIVYGNVQFSRREIKLTILTACWWVRLNLKSILLIIFLDGTPLLWSLHAALYGV
jgi:hypothetical protein